MAKRIPDEVREQIKRLRADHPGYTQKDIARLSGVSESMVRKVLGRGVYGDSPRRTSETDTKRVRPPSSTDLLTALNELRAQLRSLLADLDKWEREIEFIGTIAKRSSDATAKAERLEREIAQLREREIARAMAVHSNPYD